MFKRKKSLITVIIPAYNHEKFIGQAVESVLKQTVEDIELIVIDDGSTDNTGKIVQDIRDKRLTYIHQENQDAFNTLNRGLKLAKGQFISILNSDDVYALNRLERMLKVHKKTNAACIISDVQPILETGDAVTDPDFWWNVWHQKNRDFYFKSRDLYTGFLKGNFMVTTSNLFMTAEAVRKVGKFCSMRYLHDYDYIFRVMLNFPGGVQYMDREKLVYYRLHGDNTLSEAAVIGREQDQEVIRKYMLARLPRDLQPIAVAGVDRLIELELELIEARKQLEQNTPSA
jgi:glycosyltransferase involved in cell wall biosynthesis